MRVRLPHLLLPSSDLLFPLKTLTYNINSFTNGKFSRRVASTNALETKSGLLPLIGRYTGVVPTRLCRVQSGTKVNLRDYAVQQRLGRSSYDLRTADGVFKPANRDEFIGPNGCSLQPPESRTFQEVVRNFRGSKVGIYIIEKDTELPSDLVILHEHSDHYSLQATKEMPLTQLNKLLTQFLAEKGRLLSKQEFTAEFPFPEHEQHWYYEYTTPSATQKHGYECAALR